MLPYLSLLVPLDRENTLLGRTDIAASGMNANQVRDEMGVVFQAFRFSPNAAVLDNVTLGRQGPRPAPRIG